MGKNKLSTEQKLNNPASKSSNKISWLIVGICGIDNSFLMMRTSCRGKKKTKICDWNERRPAMTEVKHVEKCLFCKFLSYCNLNMFNLVPNLRNVQFENQYNFMPS